MKEPLDVLHVEDDPGTSRLVEEAFAESPTDVRVHAVRTGRAALSVLGGERTGVPSPDLVLLDLSLDIDAMGGLEILSEIRASSTLRSLPVVVLTDSDDSSDVRGAYERGANAYVRKPTDFDDLVAFARGATDFWAPSARTPKTV